MSADAADPEISAYLVSGRDAMYLVITPNRTLAEAAIRALPVAE